MQRKAMMGLLMSVVESELIWKVYFQGFYKGKGTKKKQQDSELVRSQDREKDVPRKGG